ncbi:hypothetical protein [Bacillus vallismortis]|nr:hypothetical protein [Bacillus vallismortis]
MIHHKARPIPRRWPQRQTMMRFIEKNRLRGRPVLMFILLSE